MKGYLDYTISLEVRGYSITEEDISSLLGLTCTEFYDENNRQNSFVKRMDDVWSHNLWVHTIETSADLFERDLISFLKSIDLQNLESSHPSVSDVRLHIMIDSSYAQIHLPFTQAQIQELSRLGINMDINVVSLGCIEKNMPKFNLKKFIKNIAVLKKHK